MYQHLKWKKKKAISISIKRRKPKNKYNGKKKKKQCYWIPARHCCLPKPSSLGCELSFKTKTSHQTRRLARGLGVQETGASDRHYLLDLTRTQRGCRRNHLSPGNSGLPQHQEYVVPEYLLSSELSPEIIFPLPWRFPRCECRLILGGL